MIAKRLLALAPLQVVQAALGIVTISAFTHWMGGVEYGAFALLMSLSMTAHTLSLTWAEAAAFRFFPRDDTADRAAHFATLRTTALCAGVLALCAASAAVLWAPYGLAAACAIAAAYFRFVTRIMRETDRADHHIAAYVASEIFYLIVSFAIGAALLMTTTLGAAAPFVGMASAGLLLMTRDAPRLLRLSRGGRASASRLKTYALYGAPLAAALGLDVAMQAATRFILAIADGPHAVGAYAAAFGLARTLDLVALTIGAAASPLLMSAYEQKRVGDLARIARSAINTYAMLAAPATVGLVLVAHPLAEVLIGPALRADVALTLPWLAMAGFCNGAALHLYSESFSLKRRTAWRAALLACAALAQCALALLLAPRFGAQGAAIASAIAALATLVLIAGGAHVLLRFPLAPAQSLRIGGALSFMALVVTLLPAPGGFAELIVKSGIGALTYGVSMLALDIGAARAVASALLQPLRARFAAR